MLQQEFISHLARKGALRDPQSFDGRATARRRDAFGDLDWVGMTKLTQSAFADELAAFYRCNRVEREDLVGSRFAGGQLSPRFLKEERVFPYEDRSGMLTLAVARPIDEETVRAAEVALRREVAVAIATADDIDAALASTLEAAQPGTDAPAEPTGVEDDLDDLRDLARGAPVVRALDDLLRLAVEQRATDLHIEPFGNVLQTRIRIDGLLKSVAAPPLSMAKGILSRLKIIAGLNITERRLPQDGRARIVVGGAEIDLRVATSPTMHGESAVVRLLRKGSGLVALDKVGLSARDEATLRAALQAPFGMIVVTGPTGSGKTTTLAASLALINQPTRKILTIEDPIEYHITGINQTQVHPAIGLTFATALRSFLRQDPDVIMVGEMRDGETAHIGVHAALTGHLVLTTLHTNTAAGAIPRLVDLGVESFLLASSVRAIVGQRLVRVLCEHCKQPRVLSSRDVAGDQRYVALGFKAGETLFDPKGCDWCSHTGFHGRLGVFEVIEVTPRVRRAIGPKTDVADLEKVALAEGMTTMTDDGVAKCRAGLTTIDEIFRVTASL
ncbi:MAG: ral secretion pathway protein [Alphaproteobacteria bacterium]|jgi:general secretion pathway protein E|nr:ral secretion pathway protein [Alphaproteobacteria bacterium]